jgi:hypothetical protein
MADYGRHETVEVLRSSLAGRAKHEAVLVVQILGYAEQRMRLLAHLVSLSGDPDTASLIEQDAEALRTRTWHAASWFGIPGPGEARHGS